jgi:hypothetical protein
VSAAFGDQVPAAADDRPDQRPDDRSDDPGRPDDRSDDRSDDPARPDDRVDGTGAGARAGAGDMVFRLTAAQGLRRRVGFLGGAAILWFLGLVRLVVADGGSTEHPLLPLVLLGAVLALGAMLLAGMAPLAVITDSAILARHGLRRTTIPVGDITAIDVRERGVSRRVVVHHRGHRTVLPVPLTGGSLLGPGADPALDHKVDLMRGWWQERSDS